MLAREAVGRFLERRTKDDATICARAIETEPELSSPDLILAGSQTITDLDAPLPALLARELRLPHLGIVSRVSVDLSGRSVTALREYPDGVRGEFEVPLLLSSAFRSPRSLLVMSRWR